MARRRTGCLGRLGAIGAAGLVITACGAGTPAAEPARPDGQSAPPVASEVRRSPERVAPERIRDRVAPDAPASADVVVRPARQELDQPAIWPAPDVVFATPEEAAADFVSSVLISDGAPALGEFRQGDARSGEIPVLFAGETGDLDPPLELGLLQVRRIGPTDGWYVISATSDGARIDAPSALDEVAAGSLTVEGEGRGFESTLVVSAFPPGDAAATFDLQIGAGGAFADLEPYSVDLDLSGAAAGEVVVILVQGDTGLASDPGTFAAIPVVVAGAPAVTIPATR